MLSQIRPRTGSRRLRIASLASGVIVVALVASVLGGCEPSAGTPAEPSDGTVAPATPAAPQVQRRDFQLRYQLDAQTVTSSAIRLRAPAGMALTDPRPLEAAVDAGQVIAQLRVNEAYASDLRVTAATNRIDAARLQQLSEGERPLEAPIAGILRDDAPGLLIEASGIDIVTKLSGVQTLRLGSMPLTGQATVETVLGTRTVDCEYLWIEEAVEDGQVVSGLHCRLPRTVETAAELRATLVVESERLRDVIVVPNASIGVDDDGYFVVLQEADGERKVPVDVGPSDGVVRVITTALPEGAVLSAVGQAP